MPQPSRRGFLRAGTLAVIPDTQYLFDADRGDSEPLEASLKYLVQARASENIVFAAHLGDVVENAAAAELAEAGRVMRIHDRHRLPYSVLAGNHDINSRTDDTRGWLEPQQAQAA